MKKLEGVANTTYVPLIARIAVSKRFPEYFFDQAALDLEAKIPAGAEKGSYEYSNVASVARYYNLDDMISAFAGIFASRSRAAWSKAAAAKEEGAKPSASSLIRETNWKKVTLITLAVLVSVAIIAGAGFVWQTFFRYDDAADIQGEWITDDGSMTVVIDDGSINMPNNLPYAYALDTWNKTISFDFQGHKA